MVTREKATEYVGYVVDDAGAGRLVNNDQFAIVREVGVPCFGYAEGPKYASVLVGYQCGNEPMFVAVHSYLDVKIDDEEAEEMARDYLTEIGWLKEPQDADYIIR